MGRIWSEENKYRQWLNVELAASEVLAEYDEVPRDAAAKLRAHADFSVDRIAEIEREIRHDVIAFTTCSSRIDADRRRAGGQPLVSLWAHL